LYLGFLKILALLLAFFFLDKERREPRKGNASKHTLYRWLFIGQLSFPW